MTGRKGAARMDTAELKALPRRVGRMKYEQVRALFDENRRRINAHGQEPCPACKTHIEREYLRCAELEAMHASYHAGVSAFDVAHAMDRHRKACPTCQTVVREWLHIDSCEATSQLRVIEQVYSHRLRQLEAKAHKAEDA